MIILRCCICDIYIDTYFSFETLFFKFYSYVYHTCCTIFFNFICFLCRCFLFLQRYVFWTHYNIVYDILLQILLWFFLWHVNYMWNLYWYIYIYFHMWKWYLIYISYISDHFFNMSRWIFFYKCIFMQFFNHFSPPDVPSVIEPIVHIVSDVVSVSVTVPGGGVHNTVGFVFIFVSGVFTHTLLWYSIPNICYYLFISYLLIICIFISLYTFHISMNFFHTSIWIFCHAYIFCKIFQKVLFTWCSISCLCTFYCHVTCCIHLCDTCWWWWTFHCHVTCCIHLSDTCWWWWI